MYCNLLTFGLSCFQFELSREEMVEIAELARTIKQDSNVTKLMEGVLV